MPINYTATRTLSRPASDKQVAFITRLAAEKAWENTTAQTVVRLVLDGVTPGSRDASNAIDALLAAPRKAAAAPAHEDAAPGYYAHDGQFYVVVDNKAGTGRYAKRLDLTGPHAEWVYAPGIQRTLDGSTVLTAEQAAAFGHMHGYCLKCLRNLSDLRSVAAGFGKTCADRLGFAYPSLKEARAIIAGWDAPRREQMADVLLARGVEFPVK